MSYDRAQLDDLAGLAGTPAWILNPERFRANFLALRGAFRALYPRTALAYSYKTNYVPALCRLADEEGGWAEVVSALEYDLARRLGVPAERIIFNGPAKEAGGLDTALAEGAIVNLDSPAEVERACALAAEGGEADFRIGLRVNLGREAGLPPSRFGLSVADGDLDRALDRLDDAGLAVEGLHCHLMVPGKTAEGFGILAEELLALHQNRFGERPLRWLDVGGGFCGPMPADLAAQFDPPPPSFADYACAVAGPFAARFTGDAGPILILEPGISLAADAVDYVTRVVDVKTIDGRTVAVADGTVYDLKPTLNTVNLPMTRIAGGGMERPGPVDVTGATCMEHDVLQRGHAGPLAPGDYLVFGNAGAYSVVLRPPFIRPAPAMARATPDGWEIERRRGGFGEIFGPYGLEDD